MTVLVTGGTGLVGSRLLKRFVEAGIETRGLVRAGKELPPGVTVVEGDILEPGTLPAAVGGVSTVIHLAALFRTADDDAVWRVNRDGTNNLIAAVRQHAPDARLIMASTSNVYAAELTHPATEGDPTSPWAAYPASKIEAEEQLQTSGLTWSIIRLPFVYGDGDGHLEALPKMAAERGWHPARTQSMAHHADIAAAFQLALTGAADGSIVNITDESPLSIYEIAQLVGEPYPSSGEPLDNPWQGQVDGSLARRLGFRATVPSVYAALREGRM
jgi:nucleoside-diphosphate-sugar epimerase